MRRMEEDIEAVIRIDSGIPYAICPTCGYVTEISDALMKSGSQWFCHGDDGACYQPLVVEPMTDSGIAVLYIHGS